MTDSTSGRAVPGAEVSLRSFGAMFGIGGAASAITGENGAYRLEGAGEGTHLLTVKAAGFVQEGLDGAGFQRMFRPGRESGDSPQSGPIIQIGPDVAEVRRDLSVVPGASIRGVVVDTNDRPVSGATVSVTGGRDARDGFGMMPGGGSGAGSAMTNPEGEFRVDGAAAGDKLKLRAAAEGYVEGFSESISVTVGAEVTGVVIRLGKGGTLTGTVVGSDGKPLGGATVRAIPWNSQPGMGPQVPTWQLRQTEGVATDEAGSFTVEGLKPGPILVGVEAPDHRQLIVKDLSVVEGQVTGGRVLALERGLAITGRLTNEAGEGVATASIWLQREQVEGVPPDFSGTGRAVVAKDGSFRVDGLAPGRYALNATGSGYAPEAVTGVAAGSSGVDILLRKGLAISGRVLLPDGSPASGSRVRVWSDADQRSASARTAEDGSFTVENLKPGTYSVSASAPRGSGPGPDRPSPLNVREATVPGVAAGTRSLEIRLVPGVSITGIVVTEAGVAVAGARVFARSAGSGASGSGMSGPDGSFEVTGLAEGEYDMNAWMQGYGPADAVKSPAPGTGVRLVLKPAPVPQEK